MSKISKTELQRIINEEIESILKENTIDEAFGDFLFRRGKEEAESDLTKLMQAINILEQLAGKFSSDKSEYGRKVHALLFKSKGSAIDAKNLIVAAGKDE